MKWSTNDIADLRRLYPIASWAQIEVRFPNSTRNAIRGVAKKYGISRDRVEVETREAWQTPEIVQRFYQLLIFADDTAIRLKQPYDRLNVIGEAMELIREGK